MKKGTKIALAVVGVLLVAGAAAAVWQWNNLSALWYGMTLDQSTLHERLEANQAALNEAMERYQISEYTFTDEESAQLADGTMTAQQAAQKLLEQDAAPSESAEEQEIRELIATMYVLRARYVERLEAVVQSAIDEYTAGAHTDENRTDVVYRRLDELIEMEKECDAEVAAVVSRLRELLEATGQDDTLARQVEEAYREEKSLKKAYYLNEFRNG